MKCIILAGGFGTRLRPAIGNDIPKCMAPIMGRPMIDLIIRNLKKQGITDITLALHHKAEQFIEYFGDKIKYKIENEPLGTGGAIKNCIEGNDPVLVLNGDTITSIDYMDMLKFHTGHTLPITLGTVEKHDWKISSGVCIINPEIFLDFSERAFSFENDVILKIGVKFYPVTWFTDYGTPETYNAAPKDWV